MLNACETMRAPGLSWRVSIGRSLSFDDESRYSVTTVRGETSAVRASCTRNSTRCSTPAAFALALRLLDQRRLDVEPTPRAPYFSAAAMGIRPSPHPRS